MSITLKSVRYFLILTLFLAGCASARAASSDSTPTQAATQASNPYAPQPGDSSMNVDTAQFVSAVTSQSGATVQMDIAYRLPTPCHTLRVVVNPPDSDGRINIKMYSLMKPNMACALMALATPLHANLDLGSFPKGHYTVYVNDEKVEEFIE